MPLWSGFVGLVWLIIRQNSTIEDATRTIFETEEVGLGTMSELQRQRDVLTSASDKAKDTVSLAMQANTILNVRIGSCVVRRREWARSSGSASNPQVWHRFVCCIKQNNRRDDKRGDGPTSTPR